jgi:transcriptional regulator with GAF, ATPase, and Fis domain
MIPTNQASSKDQNQLAEELLKICQRMSSERNLAALLDLIANEATQLMGADRASLFLLDRKGGELWSKVVLGSEEIRFDARLGIAGAVALTGETINVEDAYQDPRFYKGIDLLSGYRTQSLLAVPLRTNNGEIIGTFEVLNKETRGPFSKADEEILKALAAQAAISLENARLYEKMQQEIGQRRDAERALKRTADELQAALAEVEQLKNRLEIENVYLQEEIKTEHNFEEIIGRSAALKTILRGAEQVASSDATVLIRGETGTGKELVARAIHNLSQRKDTPLVKVNCGAIPANLVESELFGHEKGAFTGALQRRIGRFEMADGGTIFLDEVGELPSDTQVKLLRVLQDGEFERVGSSKPVKVDVRVIAATNRNLSAAIKEGAFRPDLFYRLNVFPLDMPPLRERKTDIPLLVNFFINKFGKKMGKDIKGVSKATLERMESYSWPGNVRELQNVIERAVVTASGSTIEIDDSILGADSTSHADVEALQQVERAHIIRVLKQTNWVVHGHAGAAAILRINPSTLRFRMQKLGIKRQTRNAY